MVAKATYTRSDVEFLSGKSGREFEQLLAFSDFPRPIATGDKAKSQIWSRVQVNQFLGLPLAYFPSPEWDERLSGFELPSEFQESELDALLLSGGAR